MQRLEVSGAVRLIYRSLGVKGLMRPLLLPVVQSRSRQVAVTVSLLPDTVDRVIWAPDDGWRYHAKHAEQFTYIYKPYIVASCWTIINTSCRWFVYEKETYVKARSHVFPIRMRFFSLSVFVSSVKERAMCPDWIVW